MYVTGAIRSISQSYTNAVFILASLTMLCRTIILHCYLAFSVGFFVTDLVGGHIGSLCSLIDYLTTVDLIP